ncbi:hypothetical protein KP509_29G067800 [Ceratopteris richardii]|uniref:Uncharacterized protein n=1 Tax=Ceratopteris richardii TaxID=49495 RepID=A0A8T2RAB8_CERRI|nr:hypothetical protein KP509_29G067800 [Ceratopteris richardii]
MDTELCKLLHLRHLRFKLPSWVAVVALFMLFTATMETNAQEEGDATEPLVPALFAFGDSLIDNGNNNHLRTLAKANYLPYGRDLPSHTPTGRFTNGYTALDYFAFKLGLPPPPAHSDPSTNGTRLLQGVNFASAASGIEPYTGLNFGKVFSLDAQIKQFAQVKQQIIALIGSSATDELFSKSIFFVVTGSNDWLNTYFFPGSPLPKLYTKIQYRDLLINKLVSQFEALYQLGARNFAFTGLSGVGCCPSQMRAYKAVNGTCVQWLNDLSRDFNMNLMPRLLSLPNSLPGTKFAFQDGQEVLLTIRRNAAAYGFSIVDHACCGVGKYGGFLNCFQGFPVCDDEEIHMFWDAYHPTSKFDKYFVDMLWNYGPPFSYPVSGKQIIDSVRQKDGN